MLIVAGFAGCSAPKQDVVKIGVITPLTGDGATYGEATRHGLDLALKAMGDSLKKEGLTVELIYEDDRMQATAAIGAINKLVSVDKVIGIIGPFGSSNVLSVAPMAEKLKVPMLSASATADAIADAGDYVFRNVPTNSLQGRTMADYVVGSLGVKDSIAICRLNNDYGISLAKAFKDRILELGGSVILDESMELGQTDHRTTIAKIKVTKPKFLYLPDHYNEAGHFLKQARELGLVVPMGGGDGSYSPDLLTIAGEGSQGFVLTLMGMDMNAAPYQSFAAAYKQAYGSEPDVYATYAYDGFGLLLQTVLGLRKSEQPISAEALKSAIYKADYTGVTGRTQFDSKGEVNKPFVIYTTTENGSFEPLTH